MKTVEKKSWQRCEALVDRVVEYYEWSLKYEFDEIKELRQQIYKGNGWEEDPYFDDYIDDHKDELNEDLYDELFGEHMSEEDIWYNSVGYMLEEESLLRFYGIEEY